MWAMPAKTYSPIIHVELDEPEAAIEEAASILGVGPEEVFVWSQKHVKMRLVDGVVHKVQSAWIRVEVGKDGQILAVSPDEGQEFHPDCIRWAKVDGFGHGPICSEQLFPSNTPASSAKFSRARWEEIVRRGALSARSWAIE